MKNLNWLKSIAAATVMAFPLGAPAFAADLEDVTIALSWFRNGQYTAIMAADASGYFEEEGLKLNLIDGGPGKNPFSIVAVGQADFGIGAGTSVFRSRLAATPLDIMAVGALLQSVPYSYVRLADPGDPEPRPEDMVGATIGIQTDGEVFLKGFSKANGLDYDALDIQVVQGGAEPLMTGQVDFMSMWVTNQTYQIELEAAKDDAPDTVKGKIWQAMLFADWAVPAHSDVIITQTKTVEENPELIRKVLKAIARGMQLMQDDPEKAIELTLAYPGQMDDAAKMDWRVNGGAQVSVMTSDLTREKGYLMMDPEVWAEHMEFYKDNGQIDRVMDPMDFMTNEFNPGIKSK